MTLQDLNMGHARNEMISYKPLFQTMEKKGISSYRLEKEGFSRATYYAIRHGKSISTNTVNQLCQILHCNVSEIMTFIDEEEEAGVR